MKSILLLALLATIASADDATELADASQAKRDAAANHLRDARAHGTHDWTAQLAATKLGSPIDDFVKKFSPSELEGVSSGQSSTVIYRLDDYTVIEIAHEIQTKKILYIGKPATRPRSVWVEPPKDFTGHWKTYYVDGHIEHDYEYDHRIYVTTSDYFPNGRLVMTRHYVKGQLEGPEVAFHANGKKAYEGAYQHDKQVGHWVHWFENGKVEVDETYIDGARHGTSTTNRENGEKVLFEYDHGKETGQASWDAHGKLEYAHGTAEAKYK